MLGAVQAWLPRCVQLEYELELQVEASYQPLELLVEVAQPLRKIGNTVTNYSDCEVRGHSTANNEINREPCTLAKAVPYRHRIATLQAIAMSGRNPATCESTCFSELAGLETSSGSSLARHRTQ